MQFVATKNTYLRLQKQPVFLVLKLALSLLVIWWAGAIALDSARLPLYAVVILAIYSLVSSVILLVRLVLSRLFG